MFQRAVFPFDIETRTALHTPRAEILWQQYLPTLAERL